MIDLRCCSTRELLQDLTNPVQFIHADPPWSYDSGRSGGSLRSASHDRYACMRMQDIAQDLNLAWDIAADACYLGVWCTVPLVENWMGTVIHERGEGCFRWQYLSGARWGKTGRTGMGYHFRGDAEDLHLYRKGKPHPVEGSKSNHWAAPRGSHSRKPDLALERLVRMSTREGDTVLDLYAGKTASMALVCHRLGRHYLGAEIDPEKHAEALRALTTTTDTCSWNETRAAEGDNQ